MANITLKNVSFAWVAAMGLDKDMGFLVAAGETRKSVDHPLAQTANLTFPGNMIEMVKTFGRVQYPIDTEESEGDVTINGLYNGQNLLPLDYHVHLEFRLRRGSLAKYIQCMYALSEPTTLDISSGAGLPTANRLIFPTMAIVDTPALFS